MINHSGNDDDLTTRLTRQLFGALDKRHYYKLFYAPPSYNDQLLKYLRGFNQNGYNSYRFKLIGKRNLNKSFDMSFKAKSSSN